MEQISVFDSCFNTHWVYFQGNLKTAKSRLQFDTCNLLVLWGHVRSFHSSTFLLYLQAADLLDGVLLVCPLCLMHCVLSLPIHTPNHDRRLLREPGLAEQIDMWECERQFFREEEEVNMAGCCECSAGEGKQERKRARQRKKKKRQPQP